MRKFRSIAVNWDRHQVEFLFSVGISVQENELSRINIPHDVYIKNQKLIDSWGGVAVTYPEFTRRELDRADFSAMLKSPGESYPMPMNNFKQIVYDARLCNECGIPRNQVSPFRIKDDKSKLDAFVLEWVYDVIFVRRTIFNEVFRQLGYAWRPVLIHSTGEESSNFVQLDVANSRVSVNTDGLRFEVCKRCSSKKYVPKFEDYIPPFKKVPNFDLGHSEEYFGSGGTAFQLLIFSRKMRDRFIDLKLAKRWMFHPVRNASL